MYKLSPFTYSFTKSGKTKKIFLEKELLFHPNETIAIIGPSGGGKSTLLKILKGIIPEYSSGTFEGEVTFQGSVLHGEHFQKNLKKILYLFQNPFSQLIYPTTEEEFLFSMENFNFTHTQMNTVISQFEELFGLDKVWGKKTSELSNGECQKLVLSSLLAIGPEVLLLDEPTAFLDPEARRDFYLFLNKIKGERLLIIVDHHVDEISSLVNRVIKVDVNGRIEESEFEKTETAIQALNLPVAPRAQGHRLTLQDISFSYDVNTPVLKNIRAQFSSGEIVAIKGKNGQGKSTLFKIITGILKPKNGDVILRDEGELAKPLKVFNNVGFIFQNPETHFFFDTIEEELKQSFSHLPKNYLALKEELLNRFFHEIDLQKSPFLLSEGEKRRLSILMTVFLNKKIILYDEPTFGQDQKSILEIAQLMNELKKIGLIQLFISHDDQFISQVANRVFELSEGSLNEIT